MVFFVIVIGLCLFAHSTFARVHICGGERWVPGLISIGSFAGYLVLSALIVAVTFSLSRLGPVSETHEFKVKSYLNIT